MAHEGVLLNALRLDDLSEIYAIHSDEQLRSLRMAYRSPVSQTQVEAWLSAKVSQSSEGIFFAVRESKSAPCLGYVSLTGIDWLSGTAEIGIVLSMRGQGHGTDSIRQLMDVARNQFNLRRLTARVVSYNQPAKRLFEKCGFHSEGVLIRHYFDLGEYHDVQLFACELR